MHVKEILIIIFVMIASSLFAQKGTANAVSNKNYMFAESYSDNNYACSITFKKEFKDSINNILNAYFENKELFKKRIVWKKLKENDDIDNVFYIELKKRSLKMKWENSKKANNLIVKKLKKINAAIVNKIK